MDSGSDVSLLPCRFQPDEKDTKHHNLRDCQGGSLRTTGSKDWIYEDKDVAMHLGWCWYCQYQSYVTLNSQLRVGAAKGCQRPECSAYRGKWSSLLSYISVLDHEGNEILMRHQFITADVQTGLVSLGSLYQQGWYVAPSPSGPLLLTSPGAEVQIPVHFRKNSLVRVSFYRGSYIPMTDPWDERYIYLKIKQI